jgi:hypothetical protein
VSILESAHSWKQAAERSDLLQQNEGREEDDPKQVHHAPPTNNSVISTQQLPTQYPPWRSPSIVQPVGSRRKPPWLIKNANGKMMVRLLSVFGVILNGTSNRNLGRAASRKMVGQVAELEKTIGINDLSKFTPT